MRMKHLFAVALALALPLFSATSTAFAAFQPKKIVVKVRSENFAGSGILFRHDGKAYILTSEHVLLHDPAAKLDILLSTGEVARAKLLVADFGAGLALLAPSLAPDKSLPDLQDFDSSVQSGDHVVTAGFPYASSSLNVHNTGVVMNPSSERGQLPQISQMLELSAAHGEFGMSGGAVLDSSMGRVIGILSHQFIELVPAAKSRVSEYSPGQTIVQNDIIGIPASAARGWLEEYFGNPSGFEPKFIRDAATQRAGGNAIISDGIRYELVKEDELGAPIGGKGGDGAGIGGRGGDGTGIGGRGGDGTGIGGHGGDGAGIGGASARPLGYAAKMSVADPRKSDRWNRNLRAALLAGAELRITSFVRRRSDSGGFERASISSMTRFANLLSQPDYTPIISFAVRPIESVSQSIEALKTSAQAIHDLLKDSEQKGELINSLRSVSDLLLSVNRDTVRAADIISIEKSSDWDVLFNSSFDLAVRLFKELHKIRAELEKVA